jgi:ERCC4-type nuclease
MGENTCQSMMKWRRQADFFNGDVQMPFSCSSRSTVSLFCRARARVQEEVQMQTTHDMNTAWEVSQAQLTHSVSEKGSAHTYRADLRYAA